MCMRVCVYMCVFVYVCMSRHGQHPSTNRPKETKENTIHTVTQTHKQQSDTNMTHLFACTIPDTRGNISALQSTSSVERGCTYERPTQQHQRLQQNIGINDTYLFASVECSFASAHHTLHPRSLTSVLGCAGPVK
mgnify:CR=1 FL=1